MTRFAERDEYKVSSIVGGLPTCTFQPKTYHRVITNIVVGNSVTSVVTCYRGVLGSTPVAQSLLGSKNTLRGNITIPAGQIFFVQWSAVGSAFARVSWERSDNPLDPDAVGQEWAEESITSLQIPTVALPDEAAIIIGNDLPVCMQPFYSSAIFWRPPSSLLASGGAPWYFIGQRLSTGGVGKQRVDYGFVINDGTNCGFVVYRRVQGTNIGGGVIDYLESVGSIASDGIFASMGSKQVLYMTDFNITTQTALGFTVGPGPSAFTGEVFVNSKRILSNHENISGFGTGLVTENAGTFVTLPVSSSITFIKQYADTVVNVRYHGTFYSTATSTGADFGVRFDGSGAPADTFTHSLKPTIPAALAHTPTSCDVDVPGLATDTYVCTPVFRRAGGAGTIAFDTNDFYSLTIDEVAA